MDEGTDVFAPGDSAALLVIEFPSFRDFIDTYSPIISEEGIFIRNSDISESNAFSVGDHVEFEVRLKDDFRLIQGAGEVAWLGACEAADGASGTAIRFEDVDEPSQRLISRLVGNYLRDGGTLFSVDPPTSETPDPGLDAAPEAEPDAAPETPDAAPDAAPVSSEAATAGAPATGSGDTAELTAESLHASEADELFADAAEPGATEQLEFESVSLEDVERGDSGSTPSSPPETTSSKKEAGAAAEADSSDRVGLETIAIPSGLFGTMEEEGEIAPVETGASDSAPDASLLDSTEIPPIEPPPVDLAGAESLGAPPDADGPSLPAEADQESSRPSEASDRLASIDEAAEDSGAGPAGIPDDIAQVAEELSGVHRYDPPPVEEASGIDYAGSASAGREGNTGGRIAALAVVFVLLGAGAYYFGDTILGFFGVGDGARAGEPVDMVRAGEAMPAAADTAAVDPTGDEAGSEAAPQEGGSEAEPATEPGSAAAAGREAELPADESAVAAGAAADVPSAVADAEPAAGAATRAPDAAPAAGAARRVEGITWSEEGDSTIVTIRLDREIPRSAVQVVRVRDGAPREVIKIAGVEVPYSPRDVAVGSSHVVRLRTGLHRVGAGSALHVVADLTGAAVTVLSVEPEGRDLKITFS